MCERLTTGVFLIVLVGTGFLNDSTTVLDAFTDSDCKYISYGTDTCVTDATECRW
jgi:hypothetical protein